MVRRTSEVIKICHNFLGEDRYVFLKNRRKDPLVRAGKWLRVIKTLPHPPYNPDISPCAFWLFLTLKGNLSGSCFEDIENTKEAVTRFLDIFTLDDFNQGLHGVGALMSDDPTLKED